ncbi:unnamed protein product [Amoebophrya sp. A25]|nr:unnamed protein product [Amoebophrya sp. A25]|eukprot:GSA25T00018654001.1
MQKNKMVHDYSWHSFSSISCASAVCVRGQCILLVAATSILWPAVTASASSHVVVSSESMTAEDGHQSSSSRAERLAHDSSTSFTADQRASKEQRRASATPEIERQQGEAPELQLRSSCTISRQRRDKAGARKWADISDTEMDNEHAIVALSSTLFGNAHGVGSGSVFGKEDYEQGMANAAGPFAEAASPRSVRDEVEQANNSRIKMRRTERPGRKMSDAKSAPGSPAKVSRPRQPLLGQKSQTVDVKSKPMTTERTTSTTKKRPKRENKTTGWIQPQDAGWWTNEWYPGCYPTAYNYIPTSDEQQYYSYSSGLACPSASSGGKCFYGGTRGTTARTASESHARQFGAEPGQAYYGDNGDSGWPCPWIDYDGQHAYSTSAQAWYPTSREHERGSNRLPYSSSSSSSAGPSHYSHNALSRKAVSAEAAHVEEQEQVHQDLEVKAGKGIKGSTTSSGVYYGTKLQDDTRSNVDAVMRSTKTLHHRGALLATSTAPGTKTTPEASKISEIEVGLQLDHEDSDSSSCEAGSRHYTEAHATSCSFGTASSVSSWSRSWGEPDRHMKVRTGIGSLLMSMERLKIWLNRLNLPDYTQAHDHLRGFPTGTARCQERLFDYSEQEKRCGLSENEGGRDRMEEEEEDEELQYFLQNFSDLQSEEGQATTCCLSAEQRPTVLQGGKQALQEYHNSGVYVSKECCDMISSLDRFRALLEWKSRCSTRQVSLSSRGQDPWGRQGQNYTEDDRRTRRDEMEAGFLGGPRHEDVVMSCVSNEDVGRLRNILKTLLHRATLLLHCKLNGQAPVESSIDKGYLTTKQQRERRELLHIHQAEARRFLSDEGNHMYPYGNVDNEYSGNVRLFRPNPVQHSCQYGGPLQTAGGEVVVCSTSGNDPNIEAPEGAPILVPTTSTTVFEPLEDGRETRASSHLSNSYQELYATSSPASSPAPSSIALAPAPSFAPSASMIPPAPSYSPAPSNTAVACSSPRTPYPDEDEVLPCDDFLNQLPSHGSMFHVPGGFRLCRPCVFFGKSPHSCELGAHCGFCHHCNGLDRMMRQKEARLKRKAISAKKRQRRMRAAVEAVEVLRPRSSMWWT